MVPRCSPFTLLSVTIAALLSTTRIENCHAFHVSRPPVSNGRTSVDYRTNTENDVLDTTSTKTTPLGVESPFLWRDDRNGKKQWNGQRQPTPLLMKNGQQQPSNNNNLDTTNQEHLPIADLAQRLEGTHELPNSNPAFVEFVPSEEYHQIATLSEVAVDTIENVAADNNHYPFAAMLQGSAPYIASHLGETAVFYIPGEWLHKPNQLFDSFLQDVALARLMGMKMVLVADCRMEADAKCAEEGFEHAHECNNALRVTDAQSIRQIEEEAGFIRFEIERKLNRFMKKQLVCGAGDEGNVVGGNFYSARAYGMVNGKDFQRTGFVKRVYTDNIEEALANNDVVVLTTVGCSQHGESVNVNGHHLAATVAASLNAYKLIYMANQGSVLSQKGQESQRFFQEVPLSFAKNLVDYHKVRAHKTGFATFEHARQNLEPRAVELLLNLAWSSYALEQGVTRAHIVNPKDGALLEELFTSKNGANTCLYHDDELVEDEDALDWMSAEDAEDWNDFFAEAASQSEERTEVMAKSRS